MQTEWPSAALKGQRGNHARMKTTGAVCCTVNEMGAAGTCIEGCLGVSVLSQLQAGAHCHTRRAIWSCLFVRQ